MNIRVFQDIDDSFLRSEWERLEKEADVFPQSSYHWCATWWKHLSGRRRLHVVMAVDDAGKALAIAPLCIEWHWGVRVLRSFPVNFGDFYQVLVSTIANSKEIFTAIKSYIDEHRGWHAALLTPVNDSSALYRYLVDAGIPDKHLVGNVVADISAETWDEYLASVSRNRRRLTKKKMKLLESSHKVEIQQIADVEGFYRHFERICEIQQLRATKDRSDRSARYMRCAQEVYRHLFSSGQMVLYLIKADDVIISYRLGIVRGTTFYDWNTNYDVAWSEYSPGLIGLAYVIRDLIQRGFSTVDFMAGVYDYKLSYSPKHVMRNNHQFVIGNSTLASMLFSKYQLDWRDRIKPHYRKARDLVKIANHKVRGGGQDNSYVRC